VSFYRGKPGFEKNGLFACPLILVATNIELFYNTNHVFVKMGYNVFGDWFSVGHGESDNDLTSMGGPWSFYDVMSAIQYLNDKEKKLTKLLYTEISMGAFSIFLFKCDGSRILSQETKWKFWNFVTVRTSQSLLCSITFVIKHLICDSKKEKARQTKSSRLWKHHNRLEN
jgi:hypothetical protein